MAFLDSDDVLSPFALTTYDKIICATGYPTMIIGSDKRLWEDYYIHSDFDGENIIKALKYVDYI